MMQKYIDYIYEHMNKISLKVIIIKNIYYNN